MDIFGVMEELEKRQTAIIGQELLESINFEDDDSSIYASPISPRGEDEDEDKQEVKKFREISTNFQSKEISASGTIRGHRFQTAV